MMLGFLVLLAGILILAGLFGSAIGAFLLCWHLGVPLLVWCSLPLVAAQIVSVLLMFPVFLLFWQLTVWAVFALFSWALAVFLPGQ